MPPECHWYGIVCPLSPKLSHVKFNVKWVEEKVFTELNTFYSKHYTDTENLFRLILKIVLLAKNITPHCCPLNTSNDITDV